MQVFKFLSTITCVARQHNEHTQLSELRASILLGVCGMLKSMWQGLVLPVECTSLGVSCSGLEQSCSGLNRRAGSCVSLIDKQRTEPLTAPPLRLFPIAAGYISYPSRLSIPLQQRNNLSPSHSFAMTQKAFSMSCHWLFNSLYKCFGQFLFERSPHLQYFSSSRKKAPVFNILYQQTQTRSQSKSSTSKLGPWTPNHALYCPSHCFCFLLWLLGLPNRHLSPRRKINSDKVWRNISRLSRTSGDIFLPIQDHLRQSYSWRLLDFLHERRSCILWCNWRGHLRLQRRVIFGSPKRLEHKLPESLQWKHL